MLLETDATKSLSQAGRVLSDTQVSGSLTPLTSSYTYDTAGRLIAASVHDNTLTYGYVATGGCGANVAAGKDGNRTGYSDTTTAGTAASITPVTVAYCYDNADRLTSDTVTGAQSAYGPGPLLANPLASTGTNPTLVYDSHGNTTKLANETMTYDEAGRHLSTTGAAASMVTYTRDAAGAVIGMTTTGAASDAVRYSTGAGLQFTLDAGLTAVGEITMSLPGVTVSIRSGARVWSFPDLHGDDVVTTDGSGVRGSSSLAVFDPFGDPVDLTTGLIGTVSANSEDLRNTTTTGDASYGWEGSHLKQDQHTGDIATIEMGGEAVRAVAGAVPICRPCRGRQQQRLQLPQTTPSTRTT